jgi:lipid-A-disaccharide synthase-like uncharacterized protein
MSVYHLRNLNYCPSGLISFWLQQGVMVGRAYFTPRWLAQLVREDRSLRIDLPRCFGRLCVFMSKWERVWFVIQSLSSPYNGA